jgi:DMSO/TMAO reductase YedYZ molybdopterin-dependent catalytic subunit
VSLERWEFVIDDGTNVLRRWDWKAFRDLPAETFVVDLHCVTRWSKLGTSWEGVSLDTLLKDVKIDASHAMARSYGGYTTNLPCEPPLWERRLKDEGSYRLLQHLRQCLPYGYSCC